MNLVPASGTVRHSLAFARARDARVEWLLGLHPVTADMLVKVGWFPSRAKALKRLRRLSARRRCGAWGPSTGSPAARSMCSASGGRRGTTWPTRWG